MGNFPVRGHKFCPSCGATWYLRAQRRKGGRLYPLQWKSWGRSRNRPKPPRMYWPKNKTCRDEWHIRAGIPYSRFRHTMEPISPETLPTVSLRPPKDRKDEYQERAKAKRKRHRQAQSKTRR